MAATTAKSLLRNRKPLPQILRAQIIGRSGTNINVNNVAKDHQIVQSLFTSNQKLHAQLPVFRFGEMVSLLRTSPWLSPVEKAADAGGMRDMVVEARGKFVIDDEFENDAADDDSDDNIAEEDFGDDSDEDDFNYYDETDNVSDDDEK